MERKGVAQALSWRAPGHGEELAKGPGRRSSMGVGGPATCLGGLLSDSMPVLPRWKAGMKGGSLCSVMEMEAWPGPGLGRELIFVLHTPCTRHCAVHMWSLSIAATVLGGDCPCIFQKRTPGLREVCVLSIVTCLVSSHAYSQGLGSVSLRPYRSWSSG